MTMHKRDLLIAGGIDSILNGVRTEWHERIDGDYIEVGDTIIFREMAKARVIRSCRCMVTHLIYDSNEAGEPVYVHCSIRRADA